MASAEPSFFSRVRSPPRTSISQRFLHDWGHQGILMKLRLLPSCLFLRLMNYQPFLGLTGSSLLCAAVPQIVISLLPLHKGPFAGLHAGASGRGKPILQAEPGVVWESFHWGPGQVPFWNNTGSFTQSSLGKTSASIHLSGWGSCFWGDRMSEGGGGARSDTAWPN